LSDWSISSTLSSASDILFLICSILLARLSTVFNLDYWAFHFQDFNSIFSGFLYLYWIPRSYHAFSSFFHWVIHLILFEFIQLFICFFFEFIQMFVHFLFDWSFLSLFFCVHCLRFHLLTIIQVLYYGIVTFWRHVALLFYFYLEFMHLSPSFWLEFLISYALSIEVYTMCRQDWVVPGLGCVFSRLNRRCGSVVEHWTTVLKTLCLDSDSSQTE
jgi:hypothetical protein